MAPLTLISVDDHEGFRVSARMLLEASGFDVVGEAGDRPAALAAIAAERPDVVLLDFALPGMDGIDVAGFVAEADDPPQVVLVSNRAREVYGAHLAAAPARGFLGTDELSGSTLREMLGSRAS